jgi:tRNA(Ile)-lysidine synthase TilS/MesJ
VEFVQNQLRRNVKRLRMFTPEDRILVAVSGGKDSLALWDLLLETGYSAAGLHIHLGIGEYSVRSEGVTRDFAQSRSAELIEFSLEDELGMGVPL